MSGEVMVQLAGLGLCEHCSVPLSIEGMLAEALDAEWRCPNCSGILSHRSFGYASEGGGKEKWVDPDGKWTTTKPVEDFTLGGWCVVIRPPSPPLY